LTRTIALAAASLLALAACAVTTPPPPPPTAPGAGRFGPCPDGLAGPAGAGAPPGKRFRPVWRSGAAGGRSLASRRQRSAPDRADGPWRLLADRDRRPPDHELDRRRSEEARLRRLEHRLSRVDREGGGYPGTFLDAAAATDALRISCARRYNLDVSPLVAVGHSAGGHLALWLAGRKRLPPRQPAPHRQPAPDPARGQPRRPPGPGTGAGREAAAAGSR
jgi:hypothetical protein